MKLYIKYSRLHFTLNFSTNLDIFLIMIKDYFNEINSIWISKNKNKKQEYSCHNIRYQCYITNSLQNAYFLPIFQQLI